ncbi:DUF3429 family protein [Rhodobacterales bacterium HKCCSP123]|nr:DUF3429 family protein [Rhodobacterales bacterium HKCCSP123]
MSQIPRPALILGLAGLIPFLYGALSVLVPATGAIGRLWGSNYAGVQILQAYGIVILCFMAGVIWGFAARTEGRAATFYYALSVIPAIFVFLTAFSAPRPSLVMLILGFLALLAIDASAARQGLAPTWWMSLRLLLTTVVVVCLGIGVLA